MKTEFENGTWKHCDDTYEITGTMKSPVRVVLTKSTRWGIHWYDVRTTKITRIVKDGKIKLSGLIVDVSKTGLFN